MRQAHALFDDYAHHASDKCQRGCALANVAVEISEDDDVIAALVRGFKDEIRKRLRRLAREMGARDPDELGDALMLLMEGGYYTRLAFCTEGGPMVAASAAARALIQAYLPARLRVARGRPSAAARASQHLEEWQRSRLADKDISVSIAGTTAQAEQLRACS
jgi:hypothetical protein